jgi:Sec7-like guanine-nucleotide exchange factor
VLLLRQPQVKKKMEEAEFCRNLRGVNAGQDFPKPFLSSIYHSICSCEWAVLDLYAHSKMVN